MTKIVLPRQRRFSRLRFLAWAREHHQDLLVGVQFLTVALLSLTALFQYLEYRQKRPFLTLSIASIRPVEGGAYEWVMQVDNYGSLPAFQVNRYAVGSVGGRTAFKLNVASEAAINWEPCPDRFLPRACAKPTLEKPTNMVIPPNGSAQFTFSMPQAVFQEFLSSLHPEEDGITFELDYAGPGGKGGYRPYYNQLTILPWLDGAKVQFRASAERAN